MRDIEALFDALENWADDAGLDRPPDWLNRAAAGVIMAFKPERQPETGPDQRSTWDGIHDNGARIVFCRQPETGPDQGSG